MTGASLATTTRRVDDQRLRGVADLIGKGGAEAEEGGVGARGAVQEVTRGLLQDVVGEHEAHPALDRGQQQIIRGTGGGVGGGEEDAAVDENLRRCRCR